MKKISITSSFSRLKDVQGIVSPKSAWWNNANDILSAKELKEVEELQKHLPGKRM